MALFDVPFQDNVCLEAFVTPITDMSLAALVLGHPVVIERSPRRKRLCAVLADDFFLDVVFASPVLQESLVGSEDVSAVKADGHYVCMLGVSMLEQRRVLFELQVAIFAFELPLVAVGADVLDEGDLLQKPFATKVAAESLFFVGLSVSGVGAVFGLMFKADWAHVMELVSWMLRGKMF